MTVNNSKNYSNTFTHTDIKTIKLQIEGAKKLFLLADRDSEEIIMCHVSGTEPLSGDELQVKWSFSQIFYHPAPPLIDGARIILNDKVGEGAFCAICTIPLLQSSTPTNETCFVVIRKFYLHQYYDSLKSYTFCIFGNPFNQTP